MARILPAILILITSAGVAFAVDPQVSAFDYELSVTSRPEAKTFLGVRSQTNLLRFRGESVKKIRGGSVLHPVHVAATSGADGIDVIAATEGAITPRPGHPPELADKTFYFEIKSLQFPPDGVIPLHFRFKDVTEEYGLRYSDGRGLRLVPIATKFGKLAAATVPDFVNLRVAAGSHIYQCNPLSVSASENGKSHWSTDICITGQPESISVLERFLFIKSTGGHSFYVRKDNGEILLYTASLMIGENPSDDVLALWRREIGLTFQEREKRGFFRFIKAAIILDERRSIPLLIECVEDGFGLDEKCAAVAALEKFNGNPDLWPKSFPLSSSYFLKRVGMNRVFPAANAKAEREKWEKVFKEYLHNQ